MYQPRPSLFLFNPLRFHEAAAPGPPITRHNIDMAAVKTLGTMVGITAPAYFPAAVFTTKVFNRFLKPPAHERKYNTYCLRITNFFTNILIFFSLEFYSPYSYVIRIS